MDGTRKFVEQDQLTSFVRATFGPARHLNAVVRLRGGSKKGVYRLIFDDEATAILYVWGAEENYWPKSQESTGSDRADPLLDASGFDLFEASHACLNALSIRTPQVYFLDRSKSYFPAAIAVIEDVRGGHWKPGFSTILREQNGPWFASKLPYRSCSSTGADAWVR